MLEYKNMYGEINVDWGDMTDKEIEEFVEKLNKALWRTVTGDNDGI